MAGPCPDRPDQGPDRMGGVPRIIWQLWLQGWEGAPDLAQASRRSWTRMNPGWEVRALDRAGLEAELAPETWARITATPAPPEAFSDIIRLELLARHGGVWADATTLCARPLDQWIDHAVGPGFFALSDPGGGRPLASWFLAATREDYIIAAWRRAMEDYWQGRTTRDAYFWVHNLFGKLLRADPDFAARWAQAERVPAQHAFHFGPGDGALRARAPEDLDARLAHPPAPVFKLTHKFRRRPGPRSLFRALVGWGMTGTLPPAPVPWYAPERWFGGNGAA
ncbi:capsular polysaccharide synthesis protein (plasmid) [Thioclava sp. 'Guangxiensis']|uniref:capsular polysaccharide synthesis protein n=1 Tax=Thioclava sp. 'Guangxiensis' TaxID=3149044 RepID=UPI0038778FC7